ncbi:MAG: hypothetical protein IPP32_06190 [Bacteroidetes bacterium]|nr:hypothetical protein [Bacteroidota bacterium]
MACGSCGTGANGLPGGCKNNGACGVGGCGKLTVFDWLANMELPKGSIPFDILEVRFKNGRKEFFKKEANEEYFSGDIVATEASPGHDIGVVSLTGELVRLQMKKRNVRMDSPEIRKIYRKAKPTDIEKWHAAQKLENTTMYRARTIALELKLKMKISDVEYQGDKTKAIFYYTAEERVDFRELIKVMADEFRVRVEMKQIGARQEAGRLGGIGSCGRELCCSTWLTDFRSVSTSAARYQQLSLNPLKLAGQCGKLKCCLNYELDSYMDAIKDFPETTSKLETKRGKAFHQKTDIFSRRMWYSYTEDPGNFILMTVDRVKHILEMNKREEKPDELVEFKDIPVVEKKPDYENVVGQDSLTRFDQKKKSNNRNKRKKPKAAGTASPTNAGAEPNAAANTSANRLVLAANPRPAKSNPRPPQAKQGNSAPAKQTGAPQVKQNTGAAGNEAKPQGQNRNRNKRRPPRPASTQPPKAEN